MKNWIYFAHVSELGVGQRQLKTINAQEIAVFNIDNQYYAIENECPHAYLPFAEQAPLEGTTITCPHHGAEFCLKSGEVQCPPAFEGLKTYPVRVVGDKVEVEI